MAKNQHALSIVLRALEAGCPKSFAVHLAGMSQRWFYDRCDNDPDFKAQTDAAVARSVQERVLRINKHSKRHWQADAWMLSRCHPKEFAEPSVALNQELNLSSGPTNIVVVGPERAAVLASRNEKIRAEARALVDKTNGNAQHRDL